MKRERVIISHFIIERKSQIKLFQVKIPREAKNIIAVEMGLSWSNGVQPDGGVTAEWSLPMTIKRNLTIGELKLQSYEEANIFYTGELMINQNIDNADFTSKYFVPQVYTHHSANHAEEVKVKGDTTILEGVYRDKLSEHQEGTYKYTVFVYVWIEVKEDQTQFVKS